MTKSNSVKLTKLVSSISLAFLCTTGYTQTQSVGIVSAECAALELESSTTATNARQLACYNERLTTLSDLLGGLISEREKLNSTLGQFAGTTNSQTETDGELVNQQLETIKQLQLERAELRSQLHRLLSEKQPVQLNLATDKRLFRNYSEAYVALSQENTELKKLLAEHQVAAKDQQLLLEAAGKSNLEQAAVIEQLNEEITALQQSIADLSTGKAELNTQFSKAESTIQLMQGQLLDNVELIQSQNNSLATAQKKNNERAQAIDLADQQLADAQVQNTELKAQINQYNDKIKVKRQAISDLSAHRMKLDVKYGQAVSATNELGRQLQSNTTLIQDQAGNLSAAEEENQKLANAIDDANQQLTDNQAENAEKETTLNATIDGLNDQITTLTAERDEIANKVEQAATESQLLLAQHENQLAKLSAEIDTLGSSQEELESTLESTKAKLENDATLAIQVLADNRAEHAETEGTLNSIIDDLNSQIEALNSKRAEMANRMEEAATESEALSIQHENQLAELNTEISTLGSSKDELTSALLAAEEKLNTTSDSFAEEINLLNEKSSALNADNIDLNAMLAAANLETDQLAMQSTKDMASLSDLETQLEQVMQTAAEKAADLTLARNSAVKDNTVLEAQIASLTTDLGQLEKQRDRLMKELDSTKNEAGTLNQDVTSLTEDKQKLQDSITALETRLQDTEEMSGSLEQKLASSEAEKAKALDKVKTLTTAVASLEKILDDTMANNSLIEASLGDIKNDLSASQQRLDTKQLELKALMAEKKALIDARNALNNESKTMAESIDQQLQASGIETVSVNRLADNTLSLKVDSSQLFRTGSSRLSAEGQQTLSAVGDAIAQIENRRIMIEGHSDNVPLGAKLSAIFKDNLGLSMARALTTAKFFTDASDIPANKMSVSGAGATEPLASNETAEGRQKNRRVEILLLP